MSIQISELNIYPVKSCRGFRMNSAIVTKRGFTYDRAWMIVDDQNKCLTQREKPAMALIQPQILDGHTRRHLLDELTGVEPGTKPGNEHVNKIQYGTASATSEQISASGPNGGLAGGTSVKDIAQGHVRDSVMAKPTIMQHPYEQVILQFSAPDTTPLQLQPHPQGISRTVTIWNDTCEAIDEGDEVAEWLSAYMKTSCRLVRMADEFVRSVDDRYAEAEDQVGFADAFPFLLISTESLEDLNSRLDESLPMNRFRPNIVVSGCSSSFAEDTWRQTRIGNCEFNVVKPCDRCVITTTDQETGKRGQEPLRTLAKYRNRDNKVLFGQNLIPRTTGRIGLGDQVEVLSYN